MDTPLGRSSQRRRRNWAGTQEPDFLTLMFFLLCRRCNAEKVPGNFQLEIEGSRSGSVLQSHASKCRYLSAHETACFVGSSLCKADLSL